MKNEVDRSVIVGVFEPGTRENEIKGVLDELELLIRSAGGRVLDRFYQKRSAPDKRLHIGKGKAGEIKNIACAKNANLVVFYNNLSNVQQRNLETFFKMKIVDRTRLILDVFATRARSLEGKLQVELAQLLYLLPRLTGRGVDLSRLGGGIGTRGPGETKLEADRRTINKRISIIRRKLNKVIKNREVQRKGRKTNPVPVISLVGYTSAGKSTLFRALTGEEVPVSPMLFSTLDPVLRRVEMNEVEEGYCFLLSDTVGFIRRMPTELFQAFKATLEEIVQSDLILHVIDVSDPDYLQRKEDVRKVLDQLKIPESKIIRVYNKVDLLENHREYYRDGNPVQGERIYISAVETWGIAQLKQVIFDTYFSDYKRYRIRIPQRLLNLDSLRNWAIVLTKEYEKELIDIEILCSSENMVKFKEKYGGFVTCVS